MDPISIVIAALVAGVAAGAKDIAGAEVKDTYQGLKGLIKKKFAGEPKAEMVLEEHATDPETYEAPLKKKLTEAGIDRDEEIIKAAQDLLSQAKEQPGGQDIITQSQKQKQTNNFSGIKVGGSFDVKYAPNASQEGKKS
jgi:hypothetical protein